jgi:hypothetical protein
MRITVYTLTMSDGEPNILEARLNAEVKLQASDQALLCTFYV